jgi:predicted DNA-binding transcriptional regulator AlpA
MTKEPEQLDTLLTVKDVAEILCMGVRTVWRKAHAGKIPRPVTLAPLIKRWRASDIQAYIDNLPAELN